MEQSYQPLYSDSRLQFEVEQLSGKEFPGSYHRIKMQAFNRTGMIYDLSVSFTTEQLADIVKHFFWEATVRSAWAAKILERLLRKRWAIYTNPQNKQEESEYAKRYRARCTQLDFEFVNDQRIMRKGE
ncbi:MAG: hypothetical protein Q7S12_03090 [bacterium]|nr:hypothetical protein [bacterium]